MQNNYYHSQSLLRISSNIRNENQLKKQKYGLDQIKNYLLEVPSYLIVAEGMGCYSIIRRKSIRHKLEGLFIDSDDNNLVSISKNFTEGYKMIETQDLIYHEWCSY